MPRRPIRNHHKLGYRPYAFSPFSRLIAELTFATGLNRLRRNSKLHGHEPLSQDIEDRVEEPDSLDTDNEVTIQADFAFFDPKPLDFHGVKTLLQSYLDNKQWDLSGFVDLVLAQTTVGSVVKIENDEDESIYSVVTALNLGRYKDQRCIQELKDFLLKACQGKHVLDLKSLLGEKAQDVGLLVSQHVVNLPPPLLPHLYDALFDEISWATEDEPTEELRKSFHFNFYLLVSKIYKHKDAEKSKGQNGSGDEPVLYIKPEDEIFYELSSWSFNFPLAKRVETNELKNYKLMGLVMAVEASKIPTFRKRLQSLIKEV